VDLFGFEDTDAMKNLDSTDVYGNAADRKTARMERGFHCGLPGGRHYGGLATENPKYGFEHGNVIALTYLHCISYSDKISQERNRYIRDISNP
jgi:hypothetical protein